MANNVIGNQASGEGANSSSPPQTYQQQQERIQQQQLARIQRDQQAAETAFRNASNKPATNGMRNPGIVAAYKPAKKGR